ncbi:IclR family transcriptional regulator, partial [Fusobacterium necrophorum]
SKATTFRILNTLVDLEYLSIHNKKYSLGDKFFLFLKNNTIDNYSLLKEIAYPYLERLSLEFKETFKLSILDNDKVRTLCLVESSDLNKVSFSDKAIYPVHAGAASKLLICQLPEYKLKILLDKKLPKYTENTITDPQILRKELNKIRYSKIAFDNMEHSENIKAVAIPIMNKNNRIIAAISCPCFSDKLNEKKSEEISQKMKIYAEKIKEKLFLIEDTYKK